MLDAQAIEERLAELIPQELTPYQTLFESAHYALFGGGKRLRPLLTLATCAFLGVERERALNPACALEMIHTYSLIHDDLPCMDDDDLRRGRPTLHRVVPEGIAVLAGDYLLTLAFDTLAQAPQLTPHQKLDLVICAARASGAHGLIGGQVMDLAYEKSQNQLAVIEQIHRLKTGALISAAVEFGAIMGNTTATQKKTLLDFSHLIGLAFQIVDDILDIPEKEDVEGKPTYVSLGSESQAKQRAEELLQQAIQTLTTLSGNATSLIELAKRMVYRNH